MITLVCGLGRCGTSMTMHMLKAGGHPVFADRPGSLEHSRMTTLPGEHVWMQSVDGAAIKINDPHIFTPPMGLDYAAVFLTRDHYQQAKSMQKLEAEAGKKLDRSVRGDLRKKMNWLRKSEPRCIKILRGLVKGRFLERTFESVLRDPKTYAMQLEALTKKHQQLDIPAMVNVVRERGPETLPGFIETEIYL